MQVWLVKCLTNKVGAVGTDKGLAYIADNEHDALIWATKHEDWAGDNPPWHWFILRWEVGSNFPPRSGSHYLCNGEMCDPHGVPIEPTAYTLGMDDDKPCECKDDRCDECEPDRSPLFPVKERNGLLTVALEDIKKAYEDDAHNKLASIASMLTDRLDKMCDTLSTFAEDLKDEFPER